MRPGEARLYRRGMLSPTNLLRALCALVIAAGLAFAATPAHALGGASRTWVSGVGDDANPCSRTAPCKTFAGAISKTADGGEIDVLDPGGYGTLTITQSITIDGGAGQVASLLSSGTNGIQINTTGAVVLRNLKIQNFANGAEAPGCNLSGVKILNAQSVQLENVDITNYDNGISTPASSVPTGSNVSVTADNVSVRNSYCTGINATPDPGHQAQVTVRNSDLSQDNTGFQSGPGSESWMSGTGISSNAKGLAGTGVVHDLCGNAFAANAVNGSFTDHAAACAPPVATISTGSTPSTVAFCVVPNLKGKTKAAAASALAAQHCALGSTHKKRAARAKHKKVVGQTVPAGTSVKQGTAVGILIGL